eukprot:276897_1
MCAITIRIGYIREETLKRARRESQEMGRRESYPFSYLLDKTREERARSVYTKRQNKKITCVKRGDVMVIDDKKYDPNPPKLVNEFTALAFVYWTFQTECMLLQLVKRDGVHWFML